MGGMGGAGTPKLGQAFIFRLRPDFELELLMQHVTPARLVLIFGSRASSMIITAGIDMSSRRIIISRFLHYTSIIPNA